MNRPDEITRYQANRRSETDAAAIYSALAAWEKEPRIAEIYRRMAASEAGHAEFWERKLRQAGVEPAPARPSWRARTLIWLARRLGPQVIMPTLLAGERENQQSFGGQDDADSRAMFAAEGSHALILRAIFSGPRRAIDGGMLARIEGRHHSVGGNALRAAVLGANDGLVSNLSLVMGVAGAALSGRAILITGMAGLLAGACSMAMGEWLSVQSSRELYERQIEIEQQELAESPEDEAAELALIYEAKGLNAQQARAIASGLMANREKALDTLVREELGIDPEELGGSAWEAALTSFALFAAGALVPVAPFVVMAGHTAVLASLTLSGLALFAIGAAITLLTGRGVLFSGLRQLAFGLGAAALTYGIGRLIGVAVTG